jgi:hypothetical protein
VAWKIKLYQEWKGKNTKKANMSETTKNGEKAGSPPVKTS